MPDKLRIVLGNDIHGYYDPKRQEIVDAFKLWDSLTPEERFAECQGSMQLRYYICHKNRYYPLKPIMRLVARPAIEKLPKLQADGRQYTVEETQPVAKSRNFTLAICTNRRCDQDSGDPMC